MLIAPLMVDEHELCERAFRYCPLQPELRPHVQEATEFVAMLTASLKKARTSQSRGLQNVQIFILAAWQFLRSLLM